MAGKMNPIPIDPSFGAISVPKSATRSQRWWGTQALKFPFFFFFWKLVLLWAVPSWGMKPHGSLAMRIRYSGVFLRSLGLQMI